MTADVQFILIDRQHPENQRDNNANMKTTFQIESPIGPRVMINGRQVDYFSGTGYLGLQSNPEVLQAARDCIQQYGLSTATSRGGYGEHPVYRNLEQEASLFFDTDTALLLPSGYLGLSVLLQAEGKANDHLFIDAHAHYSAWDAASITNKAITPFHHLDPASLLQKIKNELQTNETPVLLSDAVFPISGEIAPLPDYLQVLTPFGGRIYLDDAHGMGVLGSNGRGIMDHFELADPNCKVCGTLAKALGGYGGIITGNEKWIQHLEQNSGICIGASPPAIVTAAASAMALSIARLNPGLREKLRKNVKQARSGLNELGWALEDSPVPILCLPALPGQNLERIRQQLFKKGIAVTHAQNYTSTPPGGALRIAIFATHTEEQIERLIRVICSLQNGNAEMG